MSLFPVKVWIDSEVYKGGGASQDKPEDRFEHLHEKLYYVEARLESQAITKALEVYRVEEMPKHVHAHAEKSIYVEKANPK